jgi:hypothetical protein
MALEKSTEIPKIEIVNAWNIQVATDTVVKEDGAEISRSRHRHVLTPFTTSGNSDDGWTHTATDISGEDTVVQAIANAAWTNTVKAAYKTWAEADKMP